MTVLVTGGAGFLGTRLIQSLLAGASGAAPSRVICVDQVASAVEDSRVVSVIGSVADAGVVRSAVPPDITLWEAASPPETQRFLLVGVAVLIPITLAYTAYSYYVFRGKVRPGEGYHH